MELECNTISIKFELRSVCEIGLRGDETDYIYIELLDHKNFLACIWTIGQNNFQCKMQIFTQLWKYMYDVRLCSAIAINVYTIKEIHNTG